MNPIYIQRLLAVLLEEYEDVDYMLSSIDLKKGNWRKNKEIRALLQRLDKENHRLLDQFETPRRRSRPINATD